MTLIPKKHLFDALQYQIIFERISNLHNDAKPLWGKMNAAQMMAHVTEVLKNALGEKRYSRKLIGYIIAPFWRHKFYNQQPYKIKNLPSYHQFKIEGSKIFEEEKAQLLYWLKVFHEEGSVKTKDACHPLLGRFKPEQWAIGQYKHLDHHLRQFGV